MASIAYVSDNKMIEYHRLHGHRKIAFWRFSNKKFSEFSHEDFLFFLCKTKRKERGIVGYGRLSEVNNLSVKSLWKKYETLTGYQSLETLEYSISKLNKSSVFPGKLNALILEEVTYFKSPIYLSEFGFQLNKQVESYIYIDQIENITSQILNKASSIGLDLWSEIQEKRLSYGSLKLNSTLYTIALSIKSSKLYGSSRHKRITTEFNKGKRLQTLVMNENISYELKENQVHLYIPMINQNEKELFATLGLLSLIKKDDSINIIYHLIFVSEVSQQTQSLFNTLGVVCQSL